MKRLFRLSCFVLAVTLASLMFLGWTEPGLRLMTGGIERLSGGSVTFGSTGGALMISFQIEDISVSTPAVDLRVGRFASSWQLVELFTNRLHVASLAVRDIDLRIKEHELSSGSDGPILLPKIVMPFLVALDTLVVDNFRLLDSDTSELTRIDHLSFGLAGSGSWYRLIDFTLRAPGYGGNLQGMLDTGREWYVELAGDVEYKDYGTGPFAGHVSLKGPLASLDTVVDLHTPARGHIEGQIKDLPNSFSWNADLVLHNVQLADGHEILPEMVFTVTGNAEGKLLSYGGKLQGKLDYLFFKDVTFEGELHGNEDQITFTDVTAANTAGKAHLIDGLLSWKDGLMWHGHLIVQDVDPAMLDAEYPGAINAELYSSGRYNDAVGLELDADFKSFSGVLRGYELNGHGRLLVDEKSVAVDDLLLRSGKATLKLDGRAESAAGISHWQDTLKWKVGLHIVEFDPALFFPDYEGVMNTEVQSDGSIEAGIVKGMADVVTLNGVLRGYPVKGKGTVRIDNQFVEIDDVLLQSGDSTLHVAGQAGETLDLSVKLASENIGEFLEGAHGGIKLDGSVNGSRKEPRFEAAVSAKGVSYKETAVESMQAQLSGGTEATSAFKAQLNGRGLEVGSVALRTVKFDLDGLPGKHAFSADLQLKEGAVTLRGRGELADDYSWTGDILDFRGSHPLSGTWQQEGVAGAAVSMQKSFIHSFCLKSRDENICLSGDWLQEEKNWKADLNWKQLDLAHLNGVFAFPEPLSGRGSATLVASGDDTHVVSAKGLFEVEGARIGGSDSESEWSALQLDTTTLQVNLQKGILKTDLAAAFTDGSSLEIATEIPRAGSFDRDIGTLALRGNIRTDLRNLGFVAPLTKYFVLPSGALQGNFDISGTVFKPVATGTMALTDGQLEMPELGITMKNVLFQLSGKENVLEVMATASSGPGSLRAHGTLLLADSGIIGDFQCTGENFETTMLPEYEIRTNPDLHFVFDGNGGKLTGQVVVPHAILAPEKMTDSLSVSEDVLYLDSDEEVSATGWLFSTALQIELGDDVKLNGYGLSGYLRGRLLVEKATGTHMTGKGQISLAKGSYSIYGKTLDIQRSRVMFAGGPIDNPGVDVRARKIVADKKRPNETIEVGVDVTGTVDNLEFTLFSDPVMEETDILAYMVVGRARSEVGKQDESLLNSAAMAMGLQKSTGIFGELSEILPIDEMYVEGETTDEMSLVVGKHLTDDLFIGYGHNFFDQQGEVRLRYDLGSGFSVESRTSGDATGADILYSFEK